MLGAVGCSSDDGKSSDTGADGGANSTTPSGEGAGGGPAPDESTTTTPDIPGGESVVVTGTLSGVRSSPASEYMICSYLTTDQDVFALEIAARQYEVLANVVPIQLEIKDAETGEPVANLGADVTVEGVQHPDPTEVGGQSYPCDGATAYLTVTSIEQVG